MKIQPKPTSRTRQIGVRVQEVVFDLIRHSATKEGKTPTEWCSEQLSEIARSIPSAFERALLAEVSATQDIAVNLLYAMASEGKLTKERVQQITSAAHSSKYRVADELLKSAHSSTRGVRNPSQIDTDLDRRM